MINFTTEKEPKIKLFDFGAFQIIMQMLSHYKIIFHVLFGAFHITSRIFHCNNKNLPLFFVIKRLFWYRSEKNSVLLDQFFQIRSAFWTLATNNFVNCTRREPRMRPSMSYGPISSYDLIMSVRLWGTWSDYEYNLWLSASASFLTSFTVPNDGLRAWSPVLHILWTNSYYMNHILIWIFSLGKYTHNVFHKKEQSTN